MLEAIAVGLLVDLAVLLAHHVVRAAVRRFGGPLPTT